MNSCRILCLDNLPVTIVDINLFREVHQIPDPVYLIVEHRDLLLLLLPFRNVIINRLHLGMINVVWKEDLLPTKVIVPVFLARLTY